MRVACLLALLALVVLIVMALRLDGFNAALFSFVGMPSLAAAIALYVFKRWRIGAFRPSTSGPNV